MKRHSIKPVFFFCFLLLNINFLSAQTDTSFRGIKPKTSEKPSGGNAYALIIGISKYQHINQLNYADDDALAVKQMLLDTRMVTDPNNIKTLIDQEATGPKIYNELRTFLSKVQEDRNSRFIFYFAGHGDAESAFGDPYLLGVNNSGPPYQFGDSYSLLNFENQLFKIAEYCNQVIVIIDACRSGKADEMAGIKKTLSALSTSSTKKIIKILSSDGEQLSEEKEFPGVGGHGVFTYYLLEALAGLSVNDTKDRIMIRDLKDYIQEYVPANTINKQMPVITYEDNIEVTKVIPELKESLVMRNSNIKNGNLAKNKKPVATRSITDNLDISPDDSVIYKQFNDQLRSGKLNTPKGNNAYETYQSAKKKISNPELLNTMKYDLSAKLEDAVQPLLNQFIRGEFQDYPDSLFDDANNKLKIVQDELMDSTDFRYNEVKAKRIFFIASVYKTDRALELLKTAEEFMPNSTFINFEIGRHYSEVRKSYDTAAIYFNKAILLSPRWSYPRFMIGNIYFINKDLRKAETQYRQALELQPKFAFALFNLAHIFKEKRMKDSAEYYVQKAIALNPALEVQWENVDKNMESNIATMGKNMRTTDRDSENLFIGLLPRENVTQSSTDDFSAYTKAYDFNQAGNTDSAMFYYKKAVVQFENSYQKKTLPLANYYTWGFTHMKLGNYEKAIEIYTKGLNEDSLDHDYYNFGIGYVKDKQGKLRESLDWYFKSLKANPNFHFTLNNIGWNYSRLSKTDSAIYFYKKVLALKPDYTTTLYNIGDAYFSSANDDSAIIYYSKLLGVEPDWDPDLNNRIGLSHYYKERYDSAVVYLKKATELNPEKALYFSNLAMAYFDNDDYKNAIPAFETFNKYTKEDSRKYIDLALCYAYTDNYKKAESIFMEGLKYDKNKNNLHIYYYDLGWISDKQNRIQDALHWYKKAIETNPDYINAANNLGFSYDRLGKKDSAIIWYKAAIRINPEFTRAINNLALLYDDLYETDSALVYYKKLLPFFPKDALTHSKIAKLYYYNYQYDSSSHYYEKTLKLDNTKAEYFANCADVYFDWIAPDYAKYPAYLERCIQYYKSALYLDSSYYQALNRLGVSYIYLERFDEGIEIFELALKKDPVYKNTYEYNLACIFSLQQKPEKALYYFEQSIKSGYRNIDHMAADTDLDNIRYLPEFKQIIEKHFKKTDIDRNPNIFIKKN